MSKYNDYLMTVKTWDEDGEVVFYKDISHICKKGDGEHFILEDVFGNEILVSVKDDNILEVS